MEEILCRRKADLSGVKAAVFDFDGTISTLRCGWEAVMEAVMTEQLAGSLPEEELKKRIRDYIDESTGIQTICQMEWLADRVRVLCGREPLDPWDYKDIYNARLLETVNARIASLENGAAQPSAFLVPGSREFLELLARRGVRIFVASGTDDPDVRREAGLLGIAPLVSEVRGSPVRRKDNSKKEVILRILSEQKLSGAELMVVGDGKVEISLGREAGAAAVGIASDERRFGGHFNDKKLEKLEKAGADYIAADFTALNARFPNLCG